MKNPSFDSDNFLLSVLAILLSTVSCTVEEPGIKVELYSPASGLDASQWIDVSYIDDGLTRKEIRSSSSASDAYVQWQERSSSDNGKTWSELRNLDGVTQQLSGGGLVTYPGRYSYDPVFDILYQVSMRRLWPGRELYTFDWETREHPYNDHAFTLENGQAKELKFESGPDFDPNDPFDSLYSMTNRSYFGQEVEIDNDGTAYFPVTCFQSGEQKVINQGGLLLMRREPSTGEWKASNQVFLSPNISSRGLDEPDVAILNNGNLLIVCRGSNQKGLAPTTYPDSLEGRKWYSLSTDGGKTLSPIRELTYDDGSRFYSPASIHRFIRSSKNGKLYWIANIVGVVPDGNSPRYPLCISEIDEDIPAVVRSRSYIIDDRHENESERLQLSNFATLENRETLDIEVYITKIGAVEDHPRQGAVYKYNITLPGL